MFRNLTILAILTVAAVAAFGQGSGNSGPSLGKWQFTGKDNTGLVWTGTLSIEKLDPTRFDAKRYHSMCSLEVESTDPNKGTKGVEGPCTWDPQTRAVSFTVAVMETHLYTAVLSPDGKSLLQGKWTDSKKETIVSSGTWSAKLPAR